MAFVPEGQADRSQARSAWVPMQKGPRPGGTVEALSDRFNRSIVPLGRAYFPHDSRHFVPGYDRAVPPAQKPCAHRSASHYPGVYGVANLG